MADLGHTGFADFDHLVDLVRRTREVLDAAVGDGALPDGGADFLAEATLPHVEGINAGFRGWLRSDAAPIAELRYLLLQVAAARVTPPRTAGEREAAAAERRAEENLPGRSRIRGARPWDLAALAHARLVLAWLPRMPDADVRFPAGRRTYADIPAPRGPAELSARITELERQIFSVATGRPPQPADPAFRRTYGFFDAADRLGSGTFRLPG